jgi:hypothetical protein
VSRAEAFRSAAAKAAPALAEVLCELAAKYDAQAVDDLCEWIAPVTQTTREPGEEG